MDLVQLVARHSPSFLRTSLCVILADGQTTRLLLLTTRSLLLVCIYRFHLVFVIFISFKDLCYCGTCDGLLFILCVISLGCYNAYLLILGCYKPFEVYLMLSL